MGFASYARNFADVLLWRGLQEVSPGFYIDVGAAWPTQHSITKAFYDAGWRGINLEADPSLFRLLQRDRIRDLNLPLDIGGIDGQAQFDPINGMTDRTIVARPDPSNAAMRTLASIWAEHVPAGQLVHFLKVKVNAGDQDGAMLAGNNWKRNRPWIVVVEAAPPPAGEERQAEWEPILTDADYRFVYADGLNRFYLASEKTDLAARFRYPPNIFDDFVPSAQLRSQEAAETLSIRARMAEQRAEAAERALHLAQTSRTAKRLLQLAGVIERARKRYKASRLRQFGKTLTRPIRKTKPGGRAVPPAILEEDAGFTVLRLPDFDLHFANRPLADRRGIGRIAREQFRHLSARAAGHTNLPEASSARRRTIRFHSSIHWCQPNPGPGTVVMIHDVTPLLFPDLFPQPVIDEWNQSFRKIAEQAEHIVTVSRSSARTISDVLGVPDDRISVVYNGVSPIAVNRESSVATPARPYVVYVGADDYNKNVRIVLEALMLPDAAGIDLALVGDSPGLARLIKVYGLAGRVHRFGALDDGDLGYVLSRAEALVFPSLYEGFGLPPFEAAMLGIPSICSNVPAMNELIEAGVIFCDPHDPHAWARALRRIVSDGAPPRGLDQLRGTVTERFNWPNSVDQLVAVLDRFAKS
ncbi:glycosyltransferase [Kaistia granuli]|uniref:glycosyltransferase n=1 Tax=Kaistia granuli TaxID=363259 RepID=UPI0003644B00|nr:glycosyltransferase [Kaistia granuli]